MIHPRILRQATVLAVIAQLGWTGMGIFLVPRPVLFAIGQLIAAAGGYGYGLYYAGGLSACALGGTFVDGASAFIATLSAAMLGGVNGSAVPITTGAAILAGGLGGGLGGWIAAKRQREFKKGN